MVIRHGFHDLWPGSWDGVPFNGRVINLNAKFADVARARDQIRWHERPVHSDLNLGPVPISQRRCGEGNTLPAAATGRIGDE